MTEPASNGVRADEANDRVHRDAMAVSVRARFWIEGALAVIAVILFTLMLVARDWIEVLFGASLDGGDGSLELLVLGGFAIAAATFTILARAEVRRPRLRADQRQATQSPS